MHPYFNDPLAIILIVPSSHVKAIMALPYYDTPSLAREGFIHACFHHQVDYVVKRFYQGQDNLTLLVIDPDLVTAEIKYESASDAQYGNFPHVYGQINTNAIVSQARINCI